MINIEDTGGLPGVQQNGLNTAKSVNFSASPSVILPTAGVTGLIDHVTYVGQTASATDTPIFVSTGSYQVIGIREVHSVAAGGASTLQLTKDTGTQAPGAGTDLLTNNTNTGFDLNATANTVQTGTLSATTTDLQLAAGDRLSLDFANAIQSSATVSVTVAIRKI